MKTLPWAALGLLGGAAMGIILPVGMAYFIILTSDDAAGIGTPFSLLMIFTVPMGMMFGAYAGRYRARMGHWRGVFEASTHGRSPIEFQSQAWAQNFSALDKQLTDLSGEEAQSARESYLRKLEDDYESTKLNYGLLGVWLIACLVMPLLIIFPLKIAWRHYRLKRDFREHIQKAKEFWTEENSAFCLETSGLKEKKHE